ncbi:MAG: ribosome-associated translation inhibitor RaiA [Altibacter sp.]|uniref:ribosome hibernation-promoting factor, HPF/YfiA family n=1 Tax=Altibacter sp. TaxID=2024823 RepID=UPI001D3C99E1|nr:ribosome-associated translation inhibitor RaiA [Altibacter sp.]MBZ0327968.1 ribosome-associated translation inhibitor RaiA [Altibacter sp.]
MTIRIQYVKIPTSESMSDYVTKKLEKLSAKYNWLINADVYFKYENDPTGKRDTCEIELSLPGPRIFATSTDKNYESAVKKAISDLEKQLKKRKATFTTH